MTGVAFGMESNVDVYLVNKSGDAVTVELKIPSMVKGQPLMTEMIKLHNNETKYAQSLYDLNTMYIYAPSRKNNGTMSSERKGMSYEALLKDMRNRYTQNYAGKPMRINVIIEKGDKAYVVKNIEWVDMNSCHVDKSNPVK